MKHKHADVLIAIANGQDVEYYLDNKKIWVKPTILNPLDNADLEWRIKKEPVITVKYFRLRSDFPYNPTLAYREFEPDLQEWNLKVTFEDGIAIKAELPTRT